MHWRWCTSLVDVVDAIWCECMNDGGYGGEDGNDGDGAAVGVWSRREEGVSGSQRERERERERGIRGGGVVTCPAREGLVEFGFFFSFFGSY